MKQTTKSKNSWGDALIPIAAWEHIQAECVRVACRFHLNADERRDLESEILTKARLAMARKYDPLRSTPYTFIQGVVRNEILVWMDRETRRRADQVAAAVEAAWRKEVPAPAADLWLEAEEREELVRRAVERLEGTSRQICRLFLRHGTLDHAYAVMRARRPRSGLSLNRFYGLLWPKARVDFKAVWAVLRRGFGTGG